jgi:hypothetical protein
MGDGMTKEGAGCRGDVQRQMRAAAVDLAVQPRQKDGSVADSVRRPRFPPRPVDRRHGDLGAPGGDLIWSHWEAWMMAACSKFAGHTIHDDGVVRPRLRP